MSVPLHANVLICVFDDQARDQDCAQDPHQTRTGGQERDRTGTGSGTWARTRTGTRTGTRARTETATRQETRTKNRTRTGAGTGTRTGTGTGTGASTKAGVSMSLVCPISVLLALSQEYNHVHGSLTMSALGIVYINRI